jgi:aminoglycoside 3-N-acetyltransferase
MPDELTDGFLRLGVREDDRVVMHASLESIGMVDGGAAMVLHRLLNILGKKGTLLMTTFTSVTRHSSTHENYTRTGCWCEGKESLHLPFIPELQPDKWIGGIAHRLCSWPSSRRSRHPAYSFVAVGKDADGLIRDYSLVDPLHPLKTFLKQDPLVLTIGVDLDSVSAIHLAEQRLLPSKLVKERALTITSKGQAWVDVIAIGCSGGFQKLAQHISPKDRKEAQVGLAQTRLYSMRGLIEIAERLLAQDSMFLACGRPQCLSCSIAPGKR